MLLIDPKLARSGLFLQDGLCAGSFAYERENGGFGKKEGSELRELTWLVSSSGWASGHA